MIISHKYKFIFIKTRKTAGTSIELYLSKFLGKNDILTPLYPEEKEFSPLNFQGYFNPIWDLKAGIFNKPKTIVKRFLSRQKYFNHMPANLIQKRIGKTIWKNYYKFTIERNPYQKIISHYHSQKIIHGFKGNFEDYLFSQNLPIDHPLYTNKKGEIILDNILYFEDIDAELSKIFKMINIPYNGKLPVYAKKFKKEGLGITLDKYTDFLNKKFEWEFENLRYERIL